MTEFITIKLAIKSNSDLIFYKQTDDESGDTEEYTGSKHEINQYNRKIEKAVKDAILNFLNKDELENLLIEDENFQLVVNDHLEDVASQFYDVETDYSDVADTMSYEVDVILPKRKSKN